MTSPERSIKHSKFLLEYTINDRIIRRHEKNGPVVCSDQHCGEPLKVGDRVIRKWGTRSKSRLFHKRCAEKLNIL